MLKQRDREFIINGDNVISDSGVYRAAGTVFDYRRIDDAIETSDENIDGVTEWITATGPTREAIHLMVGQNKNSILFKKFPYLLNVCIPFTQCRYLARIRILASSTSTSYPSIRQQFPLLMKIDAAVLKWKPICRPRRKQTPNKWNRTGERRRSFTYGKWLALVRVAKHVVVER